MDQVTIKFDDQDRLKALSVVIGYEALLRPAVGSFTATIRRADMNNVCWELNEFYVPFTVSEEVEEWI